MDADHIKQLIDDAVSSKVAPLLEELDALRKLNKSLLDLLKIGVS